MIPVSRLLSHYLLVTITCSFILGLIGSYHFPIHLHLPSFTIALSLVSIFCLITYRSFSKSFLPLVTIFVLTGYGHGIISNPGPPSTGDVSNFVENDTEAVLVATLSKMITRKADGYQVIADAHYLRLSHSLHLFSVSGKVLLSIRDKWPESITPGKTFIVRAKFRRPHTSLSASDRFSYAQYLAEKGIFLTGSVRSSRLVHEIVAPVERTFFEASHYWIENKRATVSHFLYDSLHKDHASIYQALLLGDKSGISAELLEAFKRTGIMHILAISGMHMALLGFFLFQIIYFIARRSSSLIYLMNVRKLSMVLCLLPLLFYALLAGANTPVIRSFVMSFTFILAYCFNRPRSHLTILSTAAFVILVFDPYSLFTASFQLSFAAVSSIICLTPHLLKMLPGYDRLAPSPNGLLWVVSRAYIILGISLSATLGTIPLLLIHFNQISTVTLLTNLIIEPLVCLWTLPLGFLSLFFLFIFPALAEVCVTIGSFSLVLLKPFIVFISSIKNSALWLADLPLSLLLMYYTALAIVVAPVQYTLKKLSTVLLMVTITIAVIYFSEVQQRFRSHSSVHFLNVGQGSSSLLKLAGGRNIILDAGALTSPGFDCGKSIIAPFLWDHGISRLDDIILTHADADHYNGIPSLINRFAPKRLWLPDHGSENDGYQLLLLRARKSGVEIKRFDRDEFNSNENYSLISLAHQLELAPFNSKAGWSSNDRSQIISLRTKTFSVLFPGDISSEVENELILKAPELNHDVLLAPHHGSSTSNSLEFLQHVNPHFLIVSAGKNEHNRFPSKHTLNSAYLLGINVLETRKVGTISMRGHKGYFTIDTVDGRK